MADLSSPPAKAPKKKKALSFLKSASKPAPPLDLDHGADDDDDDDLAMFKRSKAFFPVVVKEQQESREVTPDPTADSGKRGADGDEDEEPIPSSSRSSKRRKLSSSSPAAGRDPFRETYEDLYGPATPPRRASASPSALLSGRRTRQQAAAVSSKWKGKEKETVESVQSDVFPTPRRSNSHQLPTDDVVALDDDDDPFGEEKEAAATNASTVAARRARQESKPRQAEGPSPEAVVLDDSDDDDSVEPAPEPEEDQFAYFVKRAAEREAAAKAAAAALARSDDDSDEAPAPGSDGAAAAATGPRPPKKRKPVIAVKIFVASRLGDTELPKMFGSKRGLHQDLGTVRLTFVQWLRQEGEISAWDDMERDIFLTWKGRRIYDSDSGATLGWHPSSPDGLHAAAHLPGFTRGGILLEAWTVEGFAQYQAEQERQRLMDRGELEDEGLAWDEDGEASADQQESEPPKIRLFLKEKDREPLQLTVWADTAARILAGAYRKQKGVPADREIRLRSEGEWLAPDTTVGEAEIDDMCTIEVYLK